MSFLSIYDNMYCVFSIKDGAGRLYLSVCVCVCVCEVVMKQRKVKGEHCLPGRGGVRLDRG